MTGRAVVLVAASTALVVAGLLCRAATRRAEAATTAGTIAAPRLHRVSIAGFEYRPPRLEVTAGDTVEWTNADIVSHSASADDARVFDSPDLAPRESWRTVTSTKGTFAYTCALHPAMKGTLVVK